MTNRIDNTCDIIDSYSIDKRIKELESDEENLDEWDAVDLQNLKDLAEEGKQISEWADGVTLIRDSYFETHAREFSEDMGITERDEQRWPLTYIDWEEAAEALKEDYVDLIFDGVEYWARG